MHKNPRPWYTLTSITGSFDSTHWQAVTDERALVYQLYCRKNNWFKNSLIMAPKNNPHRITEVPVPDLHPELEPYPDPDETVLPAELPDTLPEEDPFENPAPFEIPEPGKDS